MGLLTGGWLSIDFDNVVSKAFGATGVSAALNQGTALSLWTFTKMRMYAAGYNGYNVDMIVCHTPSGGSISNAVYVPTLQAWQLPCGATGKAFNVGDTLSIFAAGGVAPSSGTFSLGNMF